MIPAILRWYMLYEYITTCTYCYMLRKSNGVINQSHTWKLTKLLELDKPRITATVCSHSPTLYLLDLAKDDRVEQMKL